jgi:small GTP-binding protein
MTLAQRVSEWAKPVAELKRIMEELGADRYAAQLDDILTRLESGSADVHVAFCGLFSAGKSSLINALAGSPVMATGAVPTTEEVAMVRLDTGAGSVVLMDTPGVDSTDAAHQAAMEAALHKADLVVLVMDYQHVESEENMALARELLDRGKRLSLVVNQVDKHVDWELPFDAFRARVEQAFSDYGIEYEQIFYTSTKPGAPHSEFAEFRRWLEALVKDADRILEQSALANLTDIVQRCVSERYQEALEETEGRLFERIGFLPFDEAEAVAWRDDRQARLDELLARLDADSKRIQAEQERLAEDLRRTVELAQIAPYGTTELGRQYIESLRPGFKVGWIGAKQKTAAEQERRLQAFVGELQSRTEKFLVWPVQGRLRDWLEETDWAKPEWREQVEAVTVSVTDDLCRNQVHRGAIESEQYPYQYVRDVVASVKGQVLAEIRGVLDQWFAAERAARVAGNAEVSAERDALEAEIECLSAWLQLQAERRQMVDDLLRPVREAFSTAAVEGR